MGAAVKTRREIHNRPLHSETCNAARFQAIKERGEYFEKWPDHCQDCNGMGGVIGSGPSLRPSGIREGAVACGVCLMDAKCPRCAGRLPGVRKYDADHDRYFGWFLEKESCPHCGWNWGKDEGDAPPLIPDCTPDCVCFGGEP